MLAPPDARSPSPGMLLQRAVPIAFSRSSPRALPTLATHTQVGLQVRRAVRRTALEALTASSCHFAHARAVILVIVASVRAQQLAPCVLPSRALRLRAILRWLQHCPPQCATPSTTLCLPWPRAGHSACTSHDVRRRAAMSKRPASASATTAFTFPDPVSEQWNPIEIL